MADCIITPYLAQQIASKDVNRLVGQIAKATALNSPFVNILDGGTFAAGVSDTVRSVTQEQALPGDSLVHPNFVPTSTVCGPYGLQDATATTEFTYTLSTMRGRGPKICVKSAYAAYKGSYLMAEDSLKKVLTQYQNSDVRYTLYSRSGLKYVAANSGLYDMSTSLVGGEMQIDVKFANIPAANIGQLTFKAVSKLARQMHDVYLVEMWNEGSTDANFRFIGGPDIIEAFRAELNVITDLRYLAAGSFKAGAEAIQAYRWEGPYRGLTFGLDQRPLRATSLDGNGQPVFVEPIVGVQATNGLAGRVNPAWVAAPFEVAFLIGKHSFERLVPERYTGEGSFKFPGQITPGQLEWHYVIDNDCNAFGDFGWHQYEITRAFRPVRPHAVCAILFRRCTFDTGITVCASTGSLL